MPSKTILQIPSAADVAANDLVVIAKAGTDDLMSATVQQVSDRVLTGAAPISHVGSTGAAHGTATSAVAGFMSGADKAKLDGLAPVYETRSALAAATVHASVNAVSTAGYSTRGDGGGATYIRVASEPTHAGKVQSLDGAWWEIASAELNDRMFGARADYVLGGTGTDDTAAIQNAWLCAVAQGKRELHFYGDAYRLVTDTMSGEIIKLIGHGRPKIVAKNMSAKDVFNMLSVNEVGVQGGALCMEFIAEGANVGRFIATPRNSTQYSTFFVTYKFVGNYCRGANRDANKYSFAYDYGAAAWFHVGDCNGALIEWNNIHGAFDIKADPAGQFQDAGVLLDANAAVLSARVHNNNIGPIYQGVRVEDRVFMTMSDNDIIGAYDGLMFVDGAVLFNEPKIQRNNLNAQRYGIYINGPSGIEVANNTIRRHSSGWKGATHDWYGVYAGGISDFKLTNNTAQPDESAGAFAGVNTAYGLVGCSVSVVSGNFVGVGNDRGFHLDNCTGLVVNATTTAQNSATDVLFNLVNNTRRSVIGQYSLVSSWVGTILSRDASITGTISMINEGFDLQGTGNVSMDITRTSSSTDNKKWRSVVGSTSMNRQVISDAGTATNYELVTRSGTSVTRLEWRASEFLYNGTKFGFSAASQVPNFADDTAAAAGGVTLGQVYRTGNQLRIRIV